LNWQKSAEAIVPARGRAEHQEVRNLRVERNAEKETTSIEGLPLEGRVNPEIRRERRAFLGNREKKDDRPEVKEKC